MRDIMPLCDAISRTKRIGKEYAVVRQSFKRQKRMIK
jgi:hypothetical protein